MPSSCFSRSVGKYIILSQLTQWTEFNNYIHRGFKRQLVSYYSSTTGRRRRLLTFLFHTSDIFISSNNELLHQILYRAAWKLLTSHSPKLWFSFLSQSLLQDTTFLQNAIILHINYGSDIASSRFHSSSIPSNYNIQLFHCTCTPWHSCTWWRFQSEIMLTGERCYYGDQFFLSSEK